MVRSNLRLLSCSVAAIRADCELSEADEPGEAARDELAEAAGAVLATVGDVDGAPRPIRQTAATNTQPLRHLT
jgi:hypothetical protein